MDINNVIKNNDLGKEFYNWLINPLDKVKLIDFEDIDKNDFAVVDELPYCVVEGTEAGSFRPDVNILINGIPLSFLEVKKPNNDGGIQKEFDRMINQRLQNHEYKKYFNMLQFISFSNNMEYEDADDAEDVKAGSFYTTPNGQNTAFSFFREDDEMYHMNYLYKEVSMDTIKFVTRDCGYNPAEVDTPEFQENLQITTPCNSFITSVFDKERFIYFLNYGMIIAIQLNPQCLINDSSIWGAINIDTESLDVYTMKMQGIDEGWLVKMVQTENSGLTIVYPVDRIKEVVLLDWNRHREGIINSLGTYIGENTENGQGLNSN